MVALKGLNEHEIAPMLDYCGREGFDLTLIETMPMGAIDEDRTDRFLPLTQVFDDLSRRFALTRDAHSRSEEHTSELQSLVRNSYAVLRLNKKKLTSKQLSILST